MRERNWQLRSYTKKAMIIGFFAVAQSRRRKAVITTECASYVANLVGDSFSKVEHSIIGRKLF